MTHETALDVAARLGAEPSTRAMDAATVRAAFEDRLAAVAIEPPRQDKRATFTDRLVEDARAGICPSCRAPRMPCDACGITLAGFKIVRAY